MHTCSLPISSRITTFVRSGRDSTRTSLSPLTKRYHILNLVAGPNSSIDLPKYPARRFADSYSARFPLEYDHRMSQRNTAGVDLIQNPRACLVRWSSIVFPMACSFVSSPQSFRSVGRLQHLLRIRLPLLESFLTIKSYYSISSDHSPTQSFDEDGDSFTTFGSIQTPPRLRAMIRSIFDGTLNSPIRSFPDSDYSDAGSPLERVTDHIPAAIVAEGVNEGKTFGDRRDRLLALIPPLPFDGDPMAYSSDQDGEYELDDSTAASTPDTGPDHHPVVDESAIDLNGFHYALDTTNDPSLQLPSGADDQGDIDSVFSLIDPYEDPSDTTYVPPKERKQSRSGRKRSSGSFLAKPKPAFIRPRDSRGRFVSLQPRNLGKLRAASVDDQPLQSSSSSTTLPRAAFT
ncbi:hypothetical protein PGTUg99_003946 [Puccinia graminis f. sp. tritici]|uniref:Uncharacterized protein n=1 Tax=Puccinia graminis f. sp. tritici TaxID=56615 RepID=A0A5B0S4H4_PUCGR|nr:hypothetical protein PGTUg99_003946 [Puccinia graminis f. sp. tritici]